jgi:hypothetical protein
MPEYKVIITRKNGEPLFPNSDSYEVNMIVNNEEDARIAAYVSLKDQCDVDPYETLCDIIQK